MPIYSIIATPKLNDIDPQAWLADDAAPLLGDGGMPRLRDQEPMYASKEGRITRWEHEHVVEEVQRRQQ